MTMVEKASSERTAEVQQPWEFVLQYLAIRTGDPAETGSISVPIEKIFWDLCLVEDPPKKRFAILGEPQKLMHEIERLGRVGCVETSRDEYGKIKTATITQRGFDSAGQFAVSKEFKENGWKLGGNFTHA